MTEVGYCKSTYEVVYTVNKVVFITLEHGLVPRSHPLKLTRNMKYHDVIQVLMLANETALRHKDAITHFFKNQDC